MEDLYEKLCGYSTAKKWRAEARERLGIKARTVPIDFVRCRRAQLMSGGATSF